MVLHDEYFSYFAIRFGGKYFVSNLFLTMSSFSSQELLNNKKEKGISILFTRFVTEIR